MAASSFSKNHDPALTLRSKPSIWFDRSMSTVKKNENMMIIKMHYIISSIFNNTTKMKSLYQMCSKMLHSTKIIILVEKKKRGGLAGVWTHELDVRSRKWYPLHHGSFMMNQYFFKCHKIKMITFVLCNIFEWIWRWLLFGGCQCICHFFKQTNLIIFLSVNFEILRFLRGQIASHKDLKGL